MEPTNTERNERGGLSGRESRALASLAEANREIVAIDDLAEALETTYDSAKATASRLAQNGWLARLQPGTYLIVPLAAGTDGEYTAHEFYVASHLVEPMYVSFWSALSFHGFTEQVPRSVFLATTKRRSDRTIHGVEYHLVTLAERKFFGDERYAVGGHSVPIASPEKTLVDCADLPGHCGGVRELAKGIRTGTDGYDPERLIEYARRIENGAALKRLVYLMDRYDVDVPNRERVVDEFTTGTSPLDPTRSARGNYSSEFELYLNIEEDDIGSSTDA